MQIGFQSPQSSKLFRCLGDVRSLRSLVIKFILCLEEDLFAGYVLFDFLCSLKALSFLNFRVSGSLQFVYLVVCSWCALSFVAHMFWRLQQLLMCFGVCRSCLLAFAAGVFRRLPLVCFGVCSSYILAVAARVFCRLQLVCFGVAARVFWRLQLVYFGVCGSCVWRLQPTRLSLLRCEPKVYFLCFELYQDYNNISLPNPHYLLNEANYPASQESVRKQKQKAKSLMQPRSDVMISARCCMWKRDLRAYLSAVQLGQYPGRRVALSGSMSFSHP